MRKSLLKKVLALVIVPLLIVASPAYADDIPAQSEINNNPMFGSTYSNYSETKYYGYDRCYFEAIKTTYVFWIKYSEEVRYQEVDCDTGYYVNGWVTTL